MNYFRVTLLLRFSIIAFMILKLSAVQAEELKYSLIKVNDLDFNIVEGGSKILIFPAENNAKIELLKTSDPIDCSLFDRNIRVSLKWLEDGLCAGEERGSSFCKSEIDSINRMRFSLADSPEGKLASTKSFKVTAHLPKIFDDEKVLTAVSQKIGKPISELAITHQFPQGGLVKNSLVSRRSGSWGHEFIKYGISAPPDQLSSTFNGFKVFGVDAICDLERGRTVIMWTQNVTGSFDVWSAGLNKEEAWNAREALIQSQAEILDSKFTSLESLAGLAFHLGESVEKTNASELKTTDKLMQFIQKTFDSSTFKMKTFSNRESFDEAIQKNKSIQIFSTEAFFMGGV